MKRKMKITISALAVMFVAAIAVAIASFSFAGNGNDDVLEDGMFVADASGSVSEKTIIDYIIENSNSQDPDVDRVYHIAEITSSGTASTLDTFVSSNGFKDYVIDGNKTIETAMANDSIEYKSFNGSLNAAKDSDEYNAALTYISNADLIYVSNDSTNKFSKDNDICEDLYAALHEYAVGSFKPLIIDSPVTSTIDQDDSKQMQDLASNVFGPNEKYYYTFKWSDGLTPEQYLGHAGGSLYLGINGKTQQENGVWNTVYATQPVVDETGNVTEPNPSYLAKILTISEDGTSSRTDLLMQTADGKNPEVTTPLYTVTPAEEGGVPVTGEYTPAVNSKIYTLAPDSIMYLNGYNNRVQTRPNYIENDVVTMDEAANVDFDAYDMIVIEDNCNGLTIPYDMYRKFASAMYGKLHIVYSANMGTGTATTGGNLSDKDKRETNYMKLVLMVATTDYISNQENVMVTTRNDFSMITTTTSAKTAKVIADLINASKYRGIGGNSSSASMFTVLELQPCYPIDLQLAQSENGQGRIYSGNYYTDPSSMIDGKTKEQIPENTEYYAWELSKAKLADALGIPSEKINLVQMSTEEFAGDKTEILGTYDMIYLGGNTSALKDSAENFKALQSQYLKHNWNNQFDLTTELTKMPFYTMYTHNGDLVYVTSARNQNLSGGQMTAQASKNGNLQSTFTYLNGNDITYNRYLALKDYIDKGMPVVVSEKLTQAYQMVTANGYLQNSIDPDSNMRKVLDACAAQAAKNESNPTVVFGFKQDQVVDIFDDGSLGDTMTGYVSVFASQNGSESDSEEADPKTIVTGSKELLAQVYNCSKKKPKLIVKSMPKAYNRYDKSTILTSRTLTFKYDVINSKNFTATLYVDDDGNSKFDRSESGKELLTTSSTNTLSYECPSSFFGPVYWMLEIVDNDTGVAVNQTGFSYIKNSEDKKQEVSVLQIMPDGGGGSMGNDSLYFCTVCQRSTQILNYNPSYNEDASRHRHVVEYEGGYKDTEGTSGYLTKRNGTKIYVGKHQHIYGVNAYDSNLKLEGYQGVDDFYKNLADEAKDWYDFDIDIIRSSEFEKLSQQVRDAYTYVVNKDGTISDVVVLDGLKRTEVAQGPSTTTSKYEDYAEIETPILKAQLATHDSTQAAADVQTIKAKLKADNPDFTDAQVDDKYARLTEAEILSILRTQLISELDMDTINTLYVEKKKCDYEEAANDYQLLIDGQEGQEGEQAKVDEKKKELDEAFTELITNFSSDMNKAADQDTGKGPLAGQITRKELEDILKTGYYFDLYALANRKPMYDDISSAYLSDGKNIDTLISDYYHETDVLLKYKQAYKTFTRYAGGTDWIAECYSSVLLGPSESFNGKDITSEIALDDLETYVSEGHQVVLFHDTLTPYADAGAVKLTDRLRSYFGMDRYHMQTTAEAADTNAKTSSSNPKITDADSSYVKYTSENADKYFMTNLSFKARDDETRYGSWNSDIKISTSGYLTDVAYTDSFNLGDDSDKAFYAMPYKYAQLKYSDQTVHIQDAKFDIDTFHGRYGTNKASQNNQGLVTTFPFTIASELYIGPTHGQSYAVDLEDDNMTVWYSLAGGDSGPTVSSMFAASPRDAMDNYFLYSYKNVFYCGAGHGDILGIHKNNNDERYLFINIMCNSVRLSVAQPKISIFDYDATETLEKNEIIKKDGSNGYVMKLKEDEVYPEFNFKVSTDSETTLTNVKIFYDLDYKDGNTSNAYTADPAKHVLIADWNSSQVAKSQNKHVFRYDANLEKLIDTTGHQIAETYEDENGNTTSVAATKLKLLPEYYAPYNNEYTYIVIEATDSEGQKVYQRIKIKAVPHLFNLT
jgi:hypothetical protein